ncbi:hypothetical protein GW796_00560 [archaeon]|nr:hypothetical protein [archaeon]NCQ50396.1 hypothetical protein [archaeon]
MEASTLFECPHIIEPNDLIIHISSNNHIINASQRDNVPERSKLISRFQISPFIKDLISDVQVNNNSTLENLENIAKTIAVNLNYQKSLAFKNEIKTLKQIWDSRFSDLPFFNKLIKQYTLPDRTNYNQTSLILKLQKILFNEPNVSMLWINSIYLAIWFNNFIINKENSFETIISELWNFSKQNDLLPQLTYGQRSFVSLACELIYSIHKPTVESPILNYGDGLISYNYFKSVELSLL